MLKMLGIILLYRDLPSSTKHSVLLMIPKPHGIFQISVFPIMIFPSFIWRLWKTVVNKFDFIQPYKIPVLLSYK